jgi:hypothetical protein
LCRRDALPLLFRLRVCQLLRARELPGPLRVDSGALARGLHGGPIAVPCLLCAVQRAVRGLEAADERGNEHVRRRGVTRDAKVSERELKGLRAETLREGQVEILCEARAHLAVARVRCQQLRESCVRRRRW